MATTVRPTTARFLGSLGVNTHMDATDSAYGDVGRIGDELAYLGVSLIRDSAYDTAIPAFQALALRGIRFDLIVGGDPGYEVPSMAPLGRSVAYFEGANETDIWPVIVPRISDPVAAGIAEQRLLYATVKSSSVFSTVPVIDQSLAWPSDFAGSAATNAYADIDNAHAYSRYGTPPEQNTGYILAELNTPPGMQTFITETGYNTLISDQDGVDESVQARLTLDAVFDDFKAGVPQTFLYELMDERPDPNRVDPELHYGLFRNDGSPKPAASALHNLSAILTDALPANLLGSNLSPVVSGLPPSGASLAMVSPSGSLDLAVWAEPSVWNPVTHTEVAVTPRPVTLSLGTTVGAVSVYDPLAGTAPVATYRNVSSVTLNVTDHPLIVQAASVGGFEWTDVRTGVIGQDPGGAYSGSRSGLSHQYLWTSTDAVALRANMPGSVLQGGPGDDALQASSGSNVLDGGTGSNFLLGAPASAGGVDAFITDARGGRPTWSTVVNFHHGDQITLWGFKAGTSTQQWAANQGAAGYLGATLHSELNGVGTGVNASLTLAGLSLADLSSKVTTGTGSSTAGVPYLLLTYTG